MSQWVCRRERNELVWDHPELGRIRQIRGLYYAYRFRRRSDLERMGERIAEMLHPLSDFDTVRIARELSRYQLLRSCRSLGEAIDACRDAHARRPCVTY